MPQKKKTKKFTESKVYYIFIITYVIFVLITEILSLDFLGIRFFSLFSRSMDPAISPGSLIMVKKQSGYQAGDIIVYYAKVQNKEQIIAHRIIGLGGNVYITKGDTNQTRDQSIVLPRLIIGKAIVTIPLLGHLFGAVDSPIGVFFLVVFPALLIITAEIMKIRSFLL